MNQDERIEKLKAEVRRLNGGVDPPSSEPPCVPAGIQPGRTAAIIRPR